MVTLPHTEKEVDVFLSQPGAGVLKALKGVEGDIFILGAGGKIGKHLAMTVSNGLRELNKSNSIVAVSRFQSLHSREDFEACEIATLKCDLSIPEEVETLPDCAVLFFLAGKKFGSSSSPESLDRMNVQAPKLVAEKFKDARIVAFSTGCVYPFVPIESGGSRETDPPVPVGAYARSCLHREEQFVHASRKFGTLCSIIRLNYSVEFHYGVLVDIATKVLAGEPVDVTMGFVNLIWQSDAIAHSIQSLDNAGTPPSIINVTGPETLSVHNLASKFGKIFGKEPVYTGQEADTAWLNNAEKAHRLFGRPCVSIDDMVSWTANWLLEEGETWNKPTKFEHRDGNF